MKSNKELIVAIAEAMVIPDTPDTQDNIDYITKQLQSVNRFDLIMMFGLACGSMVANQSELNTHDKATVFVFNLSIVLNMLVHLTNAGKEGNPVPCGLWVSPECPECAKEKTKDKPKIPDDMDMMQYPELFYRQSAEWKGWHDFLGPKSDNLTEQDKLED